MGQYYRAICLDRFENLTPHSYDSGAKLMEHSYLGNNFVGAVMKLLMKDGSWYKTRMAWCGDYSGDDLGELKIYDLACSDTPLFKEINPTDVPKNEKKLILVNHSKKEYVKINKVKKDGDNWKINPLCLLTAYGNGRGGGDYSGSSMNLIGTWAFDIISVEENIKELKDYEELIPEFKEGENDGEENADEHTSEKIREWAKDNDELNKKLVIMRLKNGECN